MSVTNLSRYGSTEAPVWAARQRRKNTAADRKAHAKGLGRYAEQVAANHEIAWFTEAELANLIQASKAGTGGPNSFRGMAAYKAYRKDGKVCIRISPETARDWAIWMRQPGVGMFSDVLARLDQIAGKARPDGRAIKIGSGSFQAILATLEGPEAGAIPDAEAAAKFLRKARVENGLIYVYVSEAQAARLAEVFVAAKAGRLLILALDQIAGRTEPRPN